MLIQKLTVPLVKGKILEQATLCYVASAAISEEAFDFLTKRLRANCDFKIVTGLDLPTAPAVLRKAMGQFAQRTSLKIYTKNFFHPKVYIFVLADKSKVAFIGSGNFTMGGFQRNEELFYEITAAKEVDDLKTWFDNYYQASTVLTEKIIIWYEALYPSLKERITASQRDKKQFTDLITGAFNWENINFHNQYFIKEDYLTFENSKAPLNSPEIRAERIKVQNKLLDLHGKLKAQYCSRNGLNEHFDSNHIISSLDPIFHHEHKLRGMWLAYGRNLGELRRYSEDAKHMDFIRLQLIIEQQKFGIWLMPGKENGGVEDREFFRNSMLDDKYRNRFFDLIRGLGDPYWIEIADERYGAASFKNANDLWKITKTDDWNYYFIIGRDFEPGDVEISETNILHTIISEFRKLFPLYRYMKDKSFE